MNKHYRAKRARALANPLKKNDPRHGTVNGYNNLLCRCEQCRAAWRHEFFVKREVRRQRLLADPTLAPHGKAATYLNWGCRCELCRAAKRAQQRALRERRGG